MGTHVETLLHIFMFFSGPVAFSSELWVSNITSAFPLLTALQVQGYCSLGHGWLLLVNSSQCVYYSFAKKLGRNWVWDPGEHHRQRQRLRVGFISSLRTHSVCHPILFIYLFIIYFFLIATPEAYGSFQVRSQIRTAAAGLCNNHSNMRSELCLQPKLQLRARTDL